MKRILLVAVMILSTKLFALDFNVSQGASFIKETAYVDNKTKTYCDAKSLLVSNTALDFNSAYFNAYSEIKLGDSYRSFYFNAMSHYALNENVSFVSNISYQYYNIDFSKMNITENDVVINVGLELKETLWDFLNFKLSAFVGYVPTYSNCFSNLCETKFNIDVGISKYIEVYFSIESFQSSISFANFNPIFVKNSYGLRAHYDINNFRIFASWDYYCLHPEKAWTYELLNYNRFESYATIGLRYSF